MPSDIVLRLFTISQLWQDCLEYHGPHGTIIDIDNATINMTTGLS